MTPALVACCSKAGLAVIRSLGRRGVPVFGLSYGGGQSGIASRYLTRSFEVPDPTDDEAGFVTRVLELPKHLHGAVLIPTDDGSLVAISRNATALASLYRPTCEPWSLVRQLIEKVSTYEIARAHGIPCPRILIADSRHDALEFAREVGYPCLLKPSVGHLFFKRFRVKMLMIRGEQELLSGLDAVLDCGSELMLSEYIPGGEECGANYNSFALDGAPFCEFTAHKIRNKPKLIGFPTAVRAKPLPEVSELGRQMLAALHLNGFSCMEFKRDARDGGYKLMEVNARANYSGALASACGIDFPWLSYCRAIGTSLEPQRAQSSDELCWIDEERDAPGFAVAMTQGLAAFNAYRAPYCEPKVFAVFQRDDPRPFARLAAHSTLGAIKRAVTQSPRPQRSGSSAAINSTQRTTHGHGDLWKSRTHR